MPNTIDLSGATYTSTDGNFTFNLAELSATAILRAVERQFHHVYGNESIAKGSTARAKNPDLSDADYNAAINADRMAKLEAMRAGTWGEAGTRGPRMPAANRLEAIRNMLLADDTRKSIAKRGWKETEVKNTWVAPNGREFTLAQAMAAYEANPTLGAERRQSLDERAQAKLDFEKAEAEARKAAKARESAAVASADGELVI